MCTFISQRLGRKKSCLSLKEKHNYSYACQFNPGAGKIANFSPMPRKAAAAAVQHLSLHTGTGDPELPKPISFYMGKEDF